MASTTENQPPSTPRLQAPVRLGVLAVSAVLGLSTLPWLYFSLGEFGGFAWAMFGFEAAVLFASVFGVLIGLGKFRDGPALALACLAGTVVVAAVFGFHVDGRSKISDHATFQPWVNRMLMFRMGSALALAVLASLAVFVRDPRCWGAVARSACCLVPAALIAGYLFKFGMPIGTSGSKDPNALRVIGFLVVGLLVLVLVSAGGHFLIRAYELGRPDKRAQEAPKNAKTAS